MLADDPDPEGAIGFDRSGKEGLVTTSVEHRSGVVAHATVDCDVRADGRYFLDGPHRVEGHRGTRHDGAARLHGQRRLNSRLPGSGVEYAGVIAYRWRFFVLDVSHPQPAAHRQLLEPVRLDEASHRSKGGSEGIDQEHLRTDVEVDPLEANPGVGSGGGNRRGGSAARQRESELGVVLPGGDVVVGVGLDPGGDAQKHVEDMPGAVVDPADSLQFVEAIDDQPPRPGGGCLLELGFALVVAMNDQPVSRDTCLENDVHLSARSNIDLHLLLVGQSGHRQTEEGLAGINRPFPEGCPSLATARPQMRLVVDKEGCPELSGKVQGRATADQQLPRCSFLRCVG